jgi:hypothetical protein
VPSISVTELSRAVARTGFGALNSIVGPLVRRGVASPLPLGVGVIVLSTTGRLSGEQREVPLVAARVGEVLVVSTVRRGSSWIRNAEESPDVRVWVHGTEYHAVAEVRRLTGVDVALLRLGERVDGQSRAARTRSSAA